MHHDLNILEVVLALKNFEQYKSAIKDLKMSVTNAQNYKLLYDLYGKILITKG
jgi:hypothetical protein